MSLDDYLSSDVALPLLSNRLLTLLVRLQGPDDALEYMPCDVRWQQEELSYGLLRLTGNPEVLDKSATVFAGVDFVVRAVLSRDAVGDRKVFSFERASSRIIVAREVRDAIDAAGLTGVLFSPVAVVG